MRKCLLDLVPSLVCAGQDGRRIVAWRGRAGLGGVEGGRTMMVEERDERSYRPETMSAWTTKFSCVVERTMRQDWHRGDGRRCEGP